MAKYITKLISGETMYYLKDTEARTNLIDKTEKGAAGGVATLDNSGKVPSSQLPSYVDDVIEGYYHNGNFYTTLTPGQDNEPDTYSGLIAAEADKIYVDKSTNLTYRWSGSIYITIGSSIDNKTATYGGTDLSLVSTGEKYTWNNMLPAPIDITSLSSDYTFIKDDTLMIGTGIYRCTVASTTLPPFDFVFDENGSIVVDEINGLRAAVIDSDTLNTGWEKVAEISDRHYIEMRIKDLNTAKADKATTKTQIDALTRHTRLMDFDLNTLKKAVADQNLEKYGLKVGDQKTINGHTYVIAGLNPMKGTKTPFRVTTNHVGLIVIPHTTQAWNVSGNTSTGADERGAGYLNSDLHYYLKNTVLPMCNTDLGEANLISHNKMLSNAVNTNGYNKLGEATGCASGGTWGDTKICALSEVQVYGAAICSSSPFDIGEACCQLEVFQKYSHTEIFDNKSTWLRDVVSASTAACCHLNGDAGHSPASTARDVAALILFH